MTRQEAIERLTVSLADVISKWERDLIHDNDESPLSQAWETVGWIADDSARIMARAAMTAVEYGMSVQEHMERNGVPVND